MYIDYKQFYSSYAYNYYVNKVFTLKSTLDNFDGTLFDTYLSHDQEEYFRFLKSEIRVTAFQVVETLFELILALEPKSGKLQDYRLLENLSSSKWRNNYERISEVSEDIEKLNFLRENIIMNGQNIQKWKYLFFFGIKSSEFVQEISNSEDNVVDLTRFGLRI